MDDRTAEHELEVVVGADSIVRINVDGACVLRVRMLAGCQFRERNDLGDRLRIEDKKDPATTDKVMPGQEVVEHSLDN
jgi:hypothetical protein